MACIFNIGCGPSLNASVIPPRGLLYTNFKAPLTINFKDTNMGEKQGVKKTTLINIPTFYLPVQVPLDFDFGKVGLKETAEKADMKSIDYIDYEYTNILGVYKSLEVIPHGK